MKDKFIIIKLVLLLVVAPLAIWFGALSGTFDSYMEYCRLSKQPSIESRRENVVDLSKVTGADLVSDGSIIAEIERLFSKTGVTVSAYTPKKEEEEAGLSLMKAKLEIKGNYKSLLKVLDYLEADGRYMISGITFERKDIREKAVTLRMDISQLVRNAS